ncbi:MAG: ArnT family glycosyltransferase, partial [Nitrospinota bacterium]
MLAWKTHPAVKSLSESFGRWQVPLTPVSCGLSLFLLSLALIWQTALSKPLYESDAALFASMARDLAAAPVQTWMRMGPPLEWFFYEKPPLILWAVAAFMRLLGPVQEAALLPTLIATHLTVWLVYKIGKKLVDREFGFLAALILCLTPWFLKLGRLPKAEPFLLFFMALALYLGMRVREGKFSVLGTGVALAGAFLSKGPPALAVLPVLLVYFAMAPPGSTSDEGRNGIPWARLCLAVAIAVGILGLVDLWHYALTGSSYWRRLFAQQVAPAVLTGREQAVFAKPSSAFFFFKVLGQRYWPWLPVLLAGLIAPWVLNRGDSQRKALIGAWAFGLTQAGAILLGFSFVPKRWPGYTHPYYVGLSLLTAIAVYVFLRRRREVYRSLVSGAVVVAVAIFILASVFPALFGSHPRPKLNALIRLGEQLKARRQKIDTIQFANVCTPIGGGGFRWMAYFYLDVNSYTC